jgi:uncharacterized RDD family membrane protein YckC
MQDPLPDTDLVVATPERVSFDYQVAGLGTRGIAQMLDLLIVSLFELALFFFAAFVLAASNSDTAYALTLLIGTFVLVFGYFWTCEAFWSGQTLGKKVFRLRAVGDRGEPLTFGQAGIRNVIRIIDFLPYGYAIGLAVLFLNGKGRRLGDLAAGTVVVKDSASLPLWQLPGAFRPSAPAPPPPPGMAAAAIPAVTFAPASPAELQLRRLDPDLRRFVSAYARRRPQLTLDIRVALAASIQGPLRDAASDVFARSGPLAALDYLADLELQ